MAGSDRSQACFRINGRHVEAARGLLKITQAELAAAAGVHEETVRRFEAGENTPRPSKLEAIRAALERRGIEFTNGDNPGVKLNRSKGTIPS